MLLIYCLALLYYTHRSSKRTDEQVSGNNTAAMFFNKLKA
nr:MAG TPA: hypothetical protein [Caudoviricetes sp.]